MHHRRGIWGAASLLDSLYANLETKQKYYLAISKRFEELYIAGQVAEGTSDRTTDHRVGQDIEHGRGGISELHTIGALVPILDQTVQ